MFACAAAAFALSLSALDTIPARAAELETDARAIVGLLQTESAEDAALRAALKDVASESLALSAALRESGVTADMPCIFKGIGEDAAARADALPAQPGLARRMALSEIEALMKDAILLAPLAGAEAEKAADR